MNRSDARRSFPIVTPAFVRLLPDGMELRIKVVPGASRPSIAGLLGDRLKIRVGAAAEAGKANRAVLAMLREWLGVRDVAIVAGHTRAQKTVRIGGLREIPEERLAEIRS